MGKFPKRREGLFDSPRLAHLFCNRSDALNSSPSWLIVQELSLAVDTLWSRLLSSRCGYNMSPVTDNRVDGIRTIEEIGVERSHDERVAELNQGFVPI